MMHQRQDDHRCITVESKGDVVPMSDSETELIELQYQCARVYNILADTFGHADAIYTPAALEAMAILKSALGLEEEDLRDPGEGA